MRALLRRSNPEAVYHLDRFVMPVRQDRRTAGFGDVRQYLFAGSGSMDSIHNGIDFGLAAGTPVFASASGKVVMATQRITTGNTIVLEHLPGLYSLYYHLIEIGVRLGDTIVAGKEIGKVGSTGLATGAHLHWEVRSSGVAVDPDALVWGEIVDIPALFGVIYSSDDSTVEGGDTK